MRNRIAYCCALWLACAAAVPLFAASTGQFRNSKVIVSRVTLAPGEHETIQGDHPAILVYLRGDKAEFHYKGGSVDRQSIVRGETLKEHAEPATLVNTGVSSLELVRVEFQSNASAERWGREGLAPAYEMIYDDAYSRVYSIRMTPHAWEPMHTHRARVIVTIDGASIEHVLPDGSVHPTTLKAGEDGWREAETHKGHNLSDSALWVIAIEPK